MSSSDADIIASLNNISNGFNRYFSIFIFLFGVIGNILNILILSQKTLRTNPCSLYFLVSSVANLIAILSGLTTKMLTGWTADLTNTIDWLCKFRIFIVFLSKNIAAWLILLAAIDRWLLSNVDIHRRRISTLKNAVYAIIITIILSIVIYSPVFYCFQANLINVPIKCYSKTEACRVSNDLIYACLTIMFPIIVMFIFGLMTIVNIQKIKSRVHIKNVSASIFAGNSTVLERLTQVSKRKLDQRLFIMLIIQIFLLGLFTLPQAIQKLYSSLATEKIQSPLKIAINNFIFNLLLLFTYFANGMSFYIYTLSGGTIFRKAFKELLGKICRICH